jgi:hypothetical protein
MQIIREYLENYEKYYYCNRQLFEEDTIKDARAVLRQLGISEWKVENPLDFLEDLIKWLRTNKLYIELAAIRWAWFIIRKSRGLIKEKWQVEAQTSDEWYDKEDKMLPELLEIVKGEK